MPGSCTILCSRSHRFAKWERYTEELQFLWKKGEKEIVTNEFLIYMWNMHMCNIKIYFIDWCTIYLHLYTTFEYYWLKKIASRSRNSIPSFLFSFFLVRRLYIVHYLLLLIINSSLIRSVFSVYDSGIQYPFINLDLIEPNVGNNCYTGIYVTSAKISVMGARGFSHRIEYSLIGKVPRGKLVRLSDRNLTRYRNAFLLTYWTLKHCIYMSPPLLSSMHECSDLIMRVRAHNLGRIVCLEYIC